MPIMPKRRRQFRRSWKGYTQEDVVAVLSGKKEHTPRKKPVAAVPAAPKINLLVDIQAKLQAGKGMGYAN